MKNPLTGNPRRLGLVVRLDLKVGSVERLNALTRKTVEGIRQAEPETLIYARHAEAVGVDDATPLGERIASYRHRRGLSLVRLAAMLGRSESWPYQVERDVRLIDRIFVLTEGALNVSVGELIPTRSCGSRP